MSLTLDYLMGSSRFRRLCDRQREEAAGRFGLKRIELDVLLFLANNAPCDTARDMAELRGLAKSNISTAVESLMVGGYLTARVDEQDRRLTHLSLTEKAGPAVREGQQMQQELFARLLRGVSPEDRAALERVGETMGENLKEVLEHGI